MNDGGVARIPQITSLDPGKTRPRSGLHRRQRDDRRRRAARVCIKKLEE
jgi:hypothetical protein